MFTTFAYIEPGTTSYLLQLTIGLLAAGMFALRLFWDKIKAFFTNLSCKGKK